MKVTIEIPQSTIKAVVAMLNIEGGLTEEQVNEIADVSEVDITEGIKSNEDSTAMLIGMGMLAVGTIINEKYDKHGKEF